MSDIKHLGDITKIDGHKVPIVDIVTYGAPCQDLSVAGKRAGLAGERSGLFHEAIRIIKEMRDEYRKLHSGEADELVRPRWSVYENVPGALSSNNGEDFRIVLEETVRIADEDAVIPRPEGKWPPCGCIVGEGYSVAWRVHDAQYWGVPQRRRRLCVLGDFNGHKAAEVLFELERETDETDTNETVGHPGGERRPEVQSFSESLPGHSEPSIEKGKDTPGDPTEGIGESSCLNPWDVQSKHIQPTDGLAETLYSGECRYGGGESYVMHS